MDDFERFEELIKGGYCCISIVTHEEHYALEIVRKAAQNLKRDLWIWSIAEGVKDGLALLDTPPPVADTLKPDDGLSNLARPESLS